MYIKKLSKSGNSKAILIDKALLQAAGLNDDTLFAVVINPNGGLTIQSIESSDIEIKKAAFNKVIKENKKLLKNLSNR